VWQKRIAGRLTPLASGAVNGALHLAAGEEG
jgi:hypothetical protein